MSYLRQLAIGSFVAILVGGALLAPTATVGEPAPATALASGPWVGAWAMAPQRAVELYGPNWSVSGFADQTLRQVVRVSAAGSAVRIRLSNTYGTRPLRIARATVGRAGAGASIQRGSFRPLTFGHAAAAVIPVGRERASDPANLRVQALDQLAVTIYFAAPTGRTTFHRFATATSYRASGDRSRDPNAAAFTQTTHTWHYLVGVDIRAGASPTKAVVTFGDSITDGSRSTMGRDNRYPDELAERLLTEGTPRGVLNAGIAGNRILSDSSCYGDNALTRFRRDVVDQPGVGSVIILEGINDIGSSEADPGECFAPNPEVTARQLIEGYRQLIREAHARGIRAIGATLLPYEGAGYFSARGDAVRDAVNHWVRTSDAFDAVADFDRAVRDPDDPNRLRAAYDSGDHLHPNDAGYHAMAAAVDLAAL